MGPKLGQPVSRDGRSPLAGSDELPLLGKRIIVTGARMCLHGVQRDLKGVGKQPGLGAVPVHTDTRTRCARRRHAFGNSAPAFPSPFFSLPAPRQYSQKLSSKLINAGARPLVVPGVAITELEGAELEQVRAVANACRVRRLQQDKQSEVDPVAVLTRPVVVAAYTHRSPYLPHSCHVVPSPFGTTTSVNTAAGTAALCSWLRLHFSIVLECNPQMRGYLRALLADPHPASSLSHIAFTSKNGIFALLDQLAAVAGGEPGRWNGAGSRRGSSAGSSRHATSALGFAPQLDCEVAGGCLRVILWVNVLLYRRSACVQAWKQLAAGCDAAGCGCVPWVLTGRCWLGWGWRCTCRRRR